MRRAPLDDETHAVIVEALLRGNFLETAAALAGCTTSQVRTWLRVGSQPDADPDLRRFAIDVRRSMADAESKALGYLQDAAAMGDVKAVTWFLERRHPEHWGAKVQHVIRAEVDGILERIESLEGEIGAEAVDRVLGAVAGEWGAGEGSPEEAPGEELH